jgi:hypothetical protein
MSKTGEPGKVPPPPLDEDDNPIAVGDGSNMETFVAPTVEEVMKKLEKINAELKNLEERDKKGKTFL